MTWLVLMVNVGLVAFAAGLSYAVIRATLPMLQRHALARPNARSSHASPTPQGGGIGLVIGLLVAAWLVLLASGVPSPIHGSVRSPLAAAFGLTSAISMTVAVLALAALGMTDDLHPLGIAPRLVIQLAVAALFVSLIPASHRVLPLLPAAVETALLVVGLVWFINLTNFMDGIDQITVVAMLPIAAAIVLIAHLGVLPPLIGIFALALAGALIGFAPFNRHVARLFLGDVGSLAIGGLVGFMLIVLASNGQLAGALLLPLYYLADATITLVRRFQRGERLTDAHRSHYYQQATVAGFTVPEITRAILALNALLAVLAIATVVITSAWIDAVLISIGGLATWRLLQSLQRGPA
jgi:UDP-N-acetylmuramyl pentapeptide phosphotransferase/UDP-N-acetylglucosamine-1-phosphate transferase